MLEFGAGAGTGAASILVLWFLWPFLKKGAIFLRNKVTRIANKIEN